MTPEDFYMALKELGFDLSQKQKDQFQRYFELLVEWNEKINLTAITDKDEVFLKHFYDSLAPVLQGHIKIKVFNFWISVLELDFQVSLLKFFVLILM
mgnify:CR=1 FL=1